MRGYLRIASLKTFVTIIILAVVTFGQTASSSDEDLAAQAADTLVRRFRETRDIGVIFNEMASRKAVLALEKGDFNLGLVDEEFLKNQNIDTKKSLFRGEMTYVYIVFVFQLSYIPNVGSGKERTDFPPGFWRKYSRMLDGFRFVKRFGKEHGDPAVDRPRIKTTSDLAVYMRELESVTQLFLKYLPHDYYTVPKYKKNFAAFAADTEGIFEPKIVRQNGDSFFDIPPSENVFYVSRDIFQVTFVKEDGQMRLLGFVIGN